MAKAQEYINKTFSPNTEEIIIPRGLKLDGSIDLSCYNNLKIISMIDCGLVNFNFLATIPNKKNLIKLDLGHNPVKFPEYQNAGERSNAKPIANLTKCHTFLLNNGVAQQVVQLEQKLIHKNQALEKLTNDLINERNENKVKIAQIEKKEEENKKLENQLSQLKEENQSLQNQVKSLEKANSQTVIQTKINELKKTKGEIIKKNGLDEEEKEELENILELQSELIKNSSSVLEKQLERSKKRLNKKITEEEINSLCQLQQELTKIQMQGKNLEIEVLPK
ncbi:7964_t:CDS:2 [Funneliformis geosporum]|nr:7964_t:CDS:2 [Funneliformis geosporum]